MPDRDAKPEMERDECWFLMCENSPDGRLHGMNGSQPIAVECCSAHGELGAAHGWDRFESAGDIDG